MDIFPLLSLRALVLRSPGMFIGRQWDADGLHFLLLAIMELAVSPESLNECSTLKIVIDYSANRISLIDNGRGLPVLPIRMGDIEQAPIEHIASWYLATTSGTDYSYFQRFGFLNYLGGVLNAVSAHLQIETNFGGRSYVLTCARGEIINHLADTGASLDMGTRLNFVPDAELFAGAVIQGARIEAGVRELADKYPHAEFTIYAKANT